MEPTVTRIRRIEQTGCRHYRLEGGTLRQDWQDSLRPGDTAWCEVSIWTGPKHPPFLGSYGGTVWPSAWPALFTFGRNTTHGQPCTISPRALELFAAADADAEDYPELPKRALTRPIKGGGLFRRVRFWA